MNTEYFEKQKNRISNSVTLKLVVVSILTLLLLIPSSMIQHLISEREMRRNETVMEVTSKWGNVQNICGPILSIPYLSYVETKDGIISIKHHAHFLPAELNINGNLNPEIRYRGIYKVIAYNSVLKFNGKFDSPDFTDLKVEDKDIRWNEAFISLGVTDMRGIKKNITIDWNDDTLVINPGVRTKDIISSGVTANARVTKDKKYTFSFGLDLNGSHDLNFVPLGKETNVSIRSPWNTPSFDGAFLPDDHSITDTGFTAHWNILQLNRNYPQQWTDNEFDVDNYSFGVKLLFPVDTYQKAMRSVKYALLFIALTFLVFFFSEVLNKKKVHAIQYLLVGMALIIFYSLLVALSEHVSFNLAYLVSSVAIITMVTLFSHSVFQNKLVTVTILLTLIALYSFLFTILQLTDYSLLLGNIGLFIVLALVMHFSRKIEWYGAVNKKNGNS